MQMSKTSAKRLGAHVAACAVAASAVGAADAGLVYSGIVDLVAPANSFGIYLNLLTGANGTTAAAATGWQVRVWGTTSLRIGVNSSSDTSFVGSSPATSTLPGGRVVSLDVGSTITAAPSPSSMSAAYGWSYNEGSTGSATVGTSAGNFRLNADNYVGVYGWVSQTDYFIGWIRIAVGSAITDRTVKDWLVSTGTTAAPPDPITVGTIPAPGTVLLLGAAGIVGARRRRA